MTDAMFILSAAKAGTPNILEVLKDIVTNFPLACAAIGWFAAQMMKVFTGVFKVKKFSVRELLMGTGGMPSSHTTAVVALACACGIQCSVASVEFAMSVVFALVTMQEAVGTRRQVGEHSKALNHIFDELAAANNDPTLTQKALNELVGHTPLQVLVGAILGIIIPFLVRLIPIFNV